MKLLQFTPEVAAALEEKRPVVALESTIVAHGMDYPANVETALAVEDLVREGGAVPATIAVLHGRPRIGLSREELTHLGREGRAIMKLSTRDLPFAVAERLDGATTVAATLRLAALAGIRVFATGGMGGVHRGADKTFDISADLTEMTRSEVALVTAGAKAILDLPLTLEYLETAGVTVAGYGTGEFPAFYSRSSGLPLPLRVDTPEAAAALMRARWTLGLQGTVVLANPIPAGSEIPAGEIEPVIAGALQEALVRGVRGKETTPFLLARIAEATGGRSLAANIALVKNNARVAAAVAAAYAAGEA